MSNIISYNTNKELEDYLKKLVNKTFHNTTNKSQLFDALLNQKPLTLMVGKEEALKQNEFSLFKRNASQIQAFYTSLVEDNVFTTSEVTDMDNFEALSIINAPEYIKKIKLSDERFVESVTFIIGLCFLVRNLVLTSQSDVTELPRTHSWYQEHTSVINSLSELKRPIRSKLYNVEQELYDRCLVNYQTTEAGCSEEELKHLDTLNQVINDIQLKIDDGNYNEDATSIIIELQQIKKKLKLSKIDFDGYSYIDSKSNHRKVVYFFLLHLLSNIKVAEVSINDGYRTKVEEFDAALILFNEQLKNTHNEILKLNQKIEFATTPSQEKKLRNDIAKLKIDFLKSYVQMANQLVKKLIIDLPHDELENLI